MLYNNYIICYNFSIMCSFFSKIMLGLEVKISPHVFMMFMGDVKF